MIKFGILKSQIENVLLESYNNNTFKQEIKNFKELVLNNKNINNLYYIYDDLNTNKGLNENVINDYIYECVTIYENSINHIKHSDIEKIKSWVKNVKTENLYENIDNLFSKDILTIENRINSKKIISETLKKQPQPTKEIINLPIISMVNVANKAIVNHIDSLQESDKKELLNLLSSDDTTLNNEFDSIKENVVLKLTEMKNNVEDESTKNRIDETLSKVISEKYDKLNYFKLKNLNQNL
jgi:hypothetical protein